MSLPVALGLTSVFLALIHRTLTTWRNQNRVGKPPVISYFVPWFGSIFSIAINPDQFFERSGKAVRNGIFGATVGGNTRYYVTDAAVSSNT